MWCCLRATPNHWYCNEFCVVLPTICIATNFAVGTLSVTFVGWLGDKDSPTLCGGDLLFVWRPRGTPGVLNNWPNFCSHTKYERPSPVCPCMRPLILQDHICLFMWAYVYLMAKVMFCWEKIGIFFLLVQIENGLILLTTTIYNKQIYELNIHKQ